MSFLPNEYIQNKRIDSLLKLLSSINIDNLSISEAYYFIEKISNESKEILKLNSTI